MSSIIAVAGGSGGLGRTIVDVVKKDSRYKTFILSRKVSIFIRSISTSIID